MDKERYKSLAKKWGIIITVISLVAAIASGAKLSSDLSECGPYINPEVCLAMYKAEAPNANLIINGFYLSLFALGIGIMLLITWIIMAVTSKKNNQLPTGPVNITVTDAQMAADQPLSSQKAVTVTTPAPAANGNTQNISSSQVVYCAQCGEQNEDDQNFCNKCGQPL